MMRKYIRSLFRKRRFLVAIVAFLVVAAILNYVRWSGHPAYSFGYTLSSIDTLAYILFAILALSIVLPNAGCAIVPFGVGSLVYSGLLLILPDVVLAALSNFGPIPMLVLMFIVWIVLYSTALDKLLPARSAKVAAKASTPLSQETVWAGLCSLPENRDALYNADKIIAFERVEGTDNEFRMRERFWEAMQIERHLVLNRYDPPNAFEYSWTIPDHPNPRKMTVGTCGFHLTRSGSDATQINSNWYYGDTNIRSRFVHWIMDFEGYAFDVKLNALEARKKR